MKIIIAVILSLVVLSFGGCKEEESFPAAITKANISGEVNLYDANTTEIDNSGMKIYVEGVTPEIYATTDAEGK